MRMVPVDVPKGKPAGFTRTVSVAGVVNGVELDVENPVPVVLAVSQAESEAKLNPCGLEAEMLTVWSGGGVVEPNCAL